MQDIRLADVEIEPVAEIVYYLRGRFLKESIALLASACWKAEILSVAHGKRPVATTHLSQESFPEGLAELTELGLYVLPLRKARPVKGFAHRFYDPRPGEPFTVYCCVSRDRSLLREFRRAHELSDHGALGELLGYPECCRRFFSEVWPRDVDPILPMALNSGAKEVGRLHYVVEDYYPECLPVLRYIGLRAVPHLPCSLRCEATRQFAEVFLPYIPEDLLLSLLRQPMSFSSLYSVAIVDTPYFQVIANTTPYAERVRIDLVGVPEPRPGACSATPGAG